MVENQILFYFFKQSIHHRHLHSLRRLHLKQLNSYITAAVSYAESYQHIPEGFYKSNPMSPTTEQAVIMLSSHFYESRDGSTGGFFADNVQAGQQVWNTVNLLLRLDREWKV